MASLSGSYRSLLGDTDFDDALQEIIAELSADFHARGWMQVLRRFLLLIYWYPREMKALPNVHQANTILITSMVDERYPRALRRVCCALLCNLLVREPQLLQKNLTQASDDPATLELLSRLIFVIGSRDSVEPNVPNFVHWAVGARPVFRTIGLAGLLFCAEFEPDLLLQLAASHHDLLVRVDQKLADCMLSTSSLLFAGGGGGGGLPSKFLGALRPTSGTASASAGAGGGGGGGRASGSGSGSGGGGGGVGGGGGGGGSGGSMQLLLEPDGSPSRDFFTVLNATDDLSDDQIYHTEVFSFLHSWLYRLYRRALAIDDRLVVPTVPLAVSGAWVGGSEATFVAEHGGGAVAALAESLLRTTESILAYVQRVVEQSKLQHHGSGRSRGGGGSSGVAGGSSGGGGASVGGNAGGGAGGGRSGDGGAGGGGSGGGTVVGGHSLGGLVGGGQQQRRPYRRAVH
jgi:uncharacterized membrane protein YgcG